MPSLTDTELESMRSEVESFFDQMIDIYRGPAGSDDGYGGNEPGAETRVHRNVPCEIYPGAQHIVDMPDIGQLVNTQTYTFTVGTGTDIRKGDTVIVTTENNLKLHVTVVFDPQSQELQTQFLADKEVLNA